MSKADSGPAVACVYFFLDLSENFLFVWSHRTNVRIFECLSIKLCSWVTDL